MGKKRIRKKKLNIVSFPEKMDMRNSSDNNLNKAYDISISDRMETIVNSEFDKIKL